jgi:DNA-binding transcriptional LysR family regulator
LELDQLLIVKSILETGSVSKAALKLDRSKSVVSRQLSALEDECGGQLFYRNGRGLVLSELGESILPQIELILATARDLSQLDFAKKAVALEDVRLAITPAAGAILLPLFETLRQAHPRIRLHLSELSSADTIVALQENRIDVAVFLREGTSMRRSDRIIAEIDTYLIGQADDPLLQQDEISFNALEGLPLLMPDPPSISRRTFELAAASKGMTLTVNANPNAFGPTMRLLKAGAGYLVMPIWVGSRDPMSPIDADVRGGSLSAARIVRPRFPRTLVVRTGANASLAAQTVAQQTARVLEEAATAKRHELRAPLVAKPVTSDPV